jgi:acetyltransferase-like isoleucine patch superfamily enzyme
MTDGNLCGNGNAIVNIGPAARAVFNGIFDLGYNLPGGSNAETYLHLHDDATLIVNGHFKAFYGSSIEVFAGGTLTLGGGYINCGTVIACAKRITIGSGAAVARGVFIYDSDHHMLHDKNGARTNDAAPVTIGEHVWIGAGAIILKGVTIGDGAVIGAGAVVTGDVPARCVAAGNPARVIREGVSWN